MKQASNIFSSTPQPQCEMKLPLAYAIGSSLLSFFLPAAVMVLLYTKLYLYARRHVRSIKTQLHQATSFLIMQLASEKIREVRQLIPLYLPLSQEAPFLSHTYRPPPTYSQSPQSINHSHSPESGIFPARFFHLNIDFREPLTIYQLTLNTKPHQTLD